MLRQKLAKREANKQATETYLAKLRKLATESGEFAEFVPKIAAGQKPSDVSAKLRAILAGHSVEFAQLAPPITEGNTVYVLNNAWKPAEDESADSGAEDGVKTEATDK